MSASTVSRALSGSPLIPEATKINVRRAAEELGYLRNQAARQLASHKSFQLGFVLPRGQGRGALQLGYYATALQSCLEAAEEEGYTVSVLLHDHHEAKVLCARYASRQIDGFLLLGTTASSPLPAALAADQVPLITLGSRYPDIPAVDFDPYPGLYALLSHAAGRGLRNIIYLAGDTNFQAACDQLQSFERCCTELKLECLSTLDGRYSIRHTQAALLQNQQLLHRAHLVLCANDRSAIGAYTALRSLGHEPGNSICVAGFDDDDHARVLRPELSTVHQPREAAGKLAVSRLLAHISGVDREPLHQLLPTHAVLRSSL